MTIISLLFLLYTSSSSVPNISYVKKFIVNCSVWSALFSGSIHFHYITLSHSIFCSPSPLHFCIMLCHLHSMLESVRSVQIRLTYFYFVSIFLFFSQTPVTLFFSAITLSFPVACSAHVVGRPADLNCCARTSVRWCRWSYNRKQHPHYNTISVSPRYQAA